MVQNELLRVLTDFYELGFPDFISRDGEIITIDNMVSTLIGARRSGKSTRTLQYAKESIKNGKVDSIRNIARIDFDNPILAEMESRELHYIEESIYELNPSFTIKTPLIFIFDEIHKISGWENYVIQLSRNPFHQVIVTGSSSKLIKEDISTELRGKSISTKIHPLSFKEFISFKKEKVSSSTTGIALRRRLFDEYLQWGSFPVVALTQEEFKRPLLREYFDTMMLKDMIQRHNISKPQVATRLLNYLNSNISKPHTLKSMYEYIKSSQLKTSKDSIRSYLNHSIDSNILNSVSIYSNSLKEKENNYSKIYSVDWGLAQNNSLVWDRYYSRSFENIIFQELQRRKYDVFYYLTKKERNEIDFVTTDNRGKVNQLIQVSMDISSEDTLKRELKPLVASSKYFNPEESLIVTMNTEKTFTIEGVTVSAIPAWKWLSD